MLADSQIRARIQAGYTRLGELQRLLGIAAPASMPACFCATFGPISMAAARRLGSTGFEGLAPLISPGTYITPNYPSTVNPLVGGDVDFTWKWVALFVELSWTYTSAPGYTAPVNSMAASGLMDPVSTRNGGAIVLNNIAGTQQFSGAAVRPRVGVQLDIYDKMRARSLTNGPLTGEAFTPGHYGFIPVRPTIFPRGTEIEPRLTVTECRMTDALNATTPYNAASVAAWVTVVFKGSVAP